jgi:hypothetical protein
MSENSHWQLSKDAYDLLLREIVETKNLLEKQNGRIGKLEGWRNMFIGAWFLATVLYMVWKG